MMTVREYIKENVLLFDGGMGTYFSRKNHKPGMSCELAALHQPELIAEIHREYLEAGCKAVKTDTFAANRVVFQGDEELVRRTIAAAWKLAAEAAADYDAYVFADIGTITGPGGAENVYKEYRFVADCFLEQGAQNFLFETNAGTEGLREIAAYIREREPSAYIIVSFAVQADGFTRDGLWAGDLLAQMKTCPAADAVGFNCVCGARHMLELVGELDHEGITLSLMPNAGYPIVVNNRTFYDGDPAYFASQIAGMAAAGAAIVGGCCGTTPAHIEMVKRELRKVQRGRVEKREKPEKVRAAEDDDSLFWKKLQAGEKVVAVELDSPADANIAKFMKGAWELKGAGADIITIADCPIARARMDSSLLACKLRRELSMDALPHMTCRDRNLNATKALLFGLYAEGIRNILLVTGDPIPSAERDEVKSVYQFNSRKLAAFVTALGKKSLPGPFHIFGALNVNARNFDVQLRLAKEKAEKGMIGFLTQPVLTPQAFENLKRARRELDAYLLGGIIPVVSERNARFMDSEINGINVDPQIMELYAGKNREEAEVLAVEISKEIMKRIAPYVDGYYLMTPFGRTGLIAEILKQDI
ncbi:MAG: bifunctional homocysteine S-methyltransferase/methylenetetrahydrofolate reductase [Clostridiales bacterium]|nr:bifunctional homocysteine S-methyltransferase/methylenetetrahydrofolate reductase [Clostridiales bacterium]